MKNHIENILKIIKKECEEIIQIYRKTNFNFLYRGINRDEDFLVLKNPQNRIPRDTPKYIHDLYNFIFNSKGFSINRSNCLFVTSDKSFSMSYGIPYIIFPKNNFSYLWSEKIKDLFGETHKIFYEISKKYENVIFFEWNVTYFRKNFEIFYLYDHDFYNAKKDLLDILKQKYSFAWKSIEKKYENKLNNLRGLKYILMNEENLYKFKNKEFEEWNKKYLKSYEDSHELREILIKEIGDLYNYNTGLVYVLTNNLDNEIMMKSIGYYAINHSYEKEIKKFLM